MIQRQQTLWLILSVIGAFLSFILPFYSGTKIVNELPQAADIDGASNFFLLIITGALLILALITIFMYKNRKLQLKLCIAGSLLSVILIIIYFSEMRKFQSGSIALFCLFTFAILGGYIMAARGIWKDEKLVKSLDKLR